MGGEKLTGNNQEIVLDQLEHHGIPVSWSCRAGICGGCRVRLLEGRVTPLRQNAVSQDGTILSCSCIPAGPLRLSAV